MNIFAIKFSTMIGFFYGRFCFAVLMVIFSVGCYSVHAQDIETIHKQKILKVNGGLTANTTFYNAQGIANRRDPFYWMFSANMNLNILGIIQAPFSVTLSQQNKTFSQPQPFNRFGISPKYKNVTTHVGHRTMNFSEYTLAGVMFLGAGVEVVPKEGNVRVSAMYGQLAKAVEKSAQEGLVFAKPTFKRTGYGMKLGLGQKKNLVDLIFFKAEDDVNSIPLSPELDVTPEENLVLALHSKHEVSDKIAVELEFAHSLFTRDSRSVEATSQSYSFVNNLGGLFKPNTSTEFNDALTASVNYNGKGYQANVKYRKIDPGYRTLGSAFLNNGLKDLTGGVSWSMLQRKINISTNAGVQQSTKENSVVRVIYAGNMNYNSGNRLSLNTSYSNFSTTTRQVQIQRDIRIDSLEYFQVTRSGSFNANYKLGKENSSVALLLSANAQDATDNQDNASTFYSFNLGQQMKLLSLWQLAITASYNRNISKLMENTSVGPVMNLNRSFSEGKMRSSFSVALLKSFTEGILRSEVMNMSLTNSMRVAKKHSFGVNIYYLNNNEKGEQGRKFSEVRGMVNYNYSIW